MLLVLETFAKKPLLPQNLPYYAKFTLNTKGIQIGYYTEYSQIVKTHQVFLNGDKTEP